MPQCLEASINRHALPWSVTHCGARAELQFVPAPPTCGGQAKAAFDWPMIYYTHLFLSNRGFLITPFHNMMLVPPMATKNDIDCLVSGWDACMQELATLAVNKTTTRRPAPFASSNTGQHAVACVLPRLFHGREN